MTAPAHVPVHVVDTNVLAYLLLPGERSAAARAALRQGLPWAAPLLWRSELRNVLARHVRLGLLDTDRALALMALAEDVLRGQEYAVRSEDVLRLAASSGCSAYDCEFVSLARDLAVPLITCDAALLRAFPALTLDLARFA